MTVAEKIRRFEKLTDEKIRMLAVGAVHLHEQKTVNDLGSANDRGLTFSGGQIAGVGRFSDWIESGQFRDSLRFADSVDIDLTSSGEGFEAIQANYSEADYIAPTAKVLSDNTMNAIKKDFINNIDNVL
jgi:hypothetical protein